MNGDPVTDVTQDDPLPPEELEEVGTGAKMDDHGLVPFDDPLPPRLQVEEDE